MASALSESGQRLSQDAFDAGGMPRNGTSLEGGSGGSGGGEGRTASFQAAPDAGHGTTHRKAEPSPMRAGSPRLRQEAARPRETARFERLYAPDHIATRKLDTKVAGKMGPKGKMASAFVRGAPEKAGALRPYYEVETRYRRAAEQAMRRESVPPAYRKQVKDYFEALRR
ncbi:MAG: hypothetical protein IT210_19960 [Armatimonadetes bacterium]|nr:hypothetical protein [Armatimonadota bacterium]